MGSTPPPGQLSLPISQTLLEDELFWGGVSFTPSPTPSQPPWGWLQCGEWKLKCCKTNLEGVVEAQPVSDFVGQSMTNVEWCLSPCDCGIPQDDAIILWISTVIVREGCISQRTILVSFETDLTMSLKFHKLSATRFTWRYRCWGYSRSRLDRKPSCCLALCCL